MKMKGSTSLVNSHVPNPHGAQSYNASNRDVPPDVDVGDCDGEDKEVGDGNAEDEEVLDEGVAMAGGVVLVVVPVAEQRKF